MIAFVDVMRKVSNKENERLIRTDSNISSCYRNSIKRVKNPNKHLPTRLPKRQRMEFSTPTNVYRQPKEFEEDDVSPIGGDNSHGSREVDNYTAHGSREEDNYTAHEVRPYGQRKKTNVSDQLDQTVLTPPAPVSQSLEELKLWRHTLDITSALTRNNLVRSSSLQDVRMNLFDNCLYSHFARERTASVGDIPSCEEFDLQGLSKETVFNESDPDVGGNSACKQEVEVETVNMLKRCLDVSPSTVVGPSVKFGKDDMEVDPCTSPILREVKAADDRNSMVYSPYRDGINFTRNGLVADGNDGRTGTPSYNPCTVGVDYTGHTGTGDSTKTSSNKSLSGGVNYSGPVRGGTDGWPKGEQHIPTTKTKRKKKIARRTLEPGQKLLPEMFGGVFKPSIKFNKGGDDEDEKDDGPNGTGN